VAGEGGFVMTAQELSVAVKHRLDVKIVLLNNFSLGMVRQFQDDFYGGIRSEVDLTEMPDFVKLADAFGVRARAVTTRADVVDAVQAARDHGGPALIDFRVEQEDSVYPMVPAGADLHRMIRRPSPIAETATDA
jgi:acetolactate synthase-1/2/3 large subunit